MKSDLVGMDKAAGLNIAFDHDPFDGGRFSILRAIASSRFWGFFR